MSRVALGCSVYRPSFDLPGGRISKVLLWTEAREDERDRVVSIVSEHTPINHHVVRGIWIKPRQSPRYQGKADDPSNGPSPKDS